jgi:hypothetical protein
MKETIAVTGIVVVGVLAIGAFGLACGTVAGKIGEKVVDIYYDHLKKTR